jgi:hypothetical protein
MVGKLRAISTAGLSSGAVVRALPPTRLQAVYFGTPSFALARELRTGKTMDLAESKPSISDTDESVEVQHTRATFRFGSTARRNHVESTEKKTLAGEIRALVLGDRLVNAAERAAEPLDDSRPFNNTAEPAMEACDDDIAAAGATAIADIEKLIEELLVARDYLQSEGERVRQVTGRYAHLTKTASASARIISESLGKWHNPEPERPMRLSDAAVHLSPAPSLSPVDDGEMQHTEPNDPSAMTD